MFSSWLNPFGWGQGFSFANSGPAELVAISPAITPVTRVQSAGGPSSPPTWLQWITGLSNAGLGWFQAVSANDVANESIAHGFPVTTTSPSGNNVLSGAVSSLSSFLPIIIIVVVLVVILKSFGRR